MLKQILITIFVINSGFLLAGDCRSFREKFFSTIKNAYNFQENSKLTSVIEAIVESEKKWSEWYEGYSNDGAQIAINITDIMKQKWLRWHQWKNGQSTVICCNDFKSPYYERVEFEDCNIASIDNTNKFKGTAYDLYNINLLENEAYHDELFFLETQLLEVELNIVMETVESNRERYKNTSTRLKEEIESFKKPENRVAFSKSCVKKQDAELLHMMRNSFKSEHGRNVFHDFCYVREQENIS